MSSRTQGKQKQTARARAPILPPELMAMMRLVEGQKYPELELAARQYLSKRPGQALAEKMLGFALLGLRRYEEALPLLRHSVSRNPQDPELRHNLGIALSQLMHWEESLQAFELALQGMPHDPQVSKDMGLALFRMQRWNDAVPHLLQAIEHYEGDYIEAVELLAACLLNANRVDEAWTCYNQLHMAEPSHVMNLFNLIYSGLRRSYWSDYPVLMQKLRDVSRNFQDCAVIPFSLLAFTGVTHSECAQVSTKFVKAQIPASVLNTASRIAPLSHEGRRIRIGYLSGDFLRHPVGFIIPEMIELHDRHRFEVFAYSTRPADENDPIRPRLQKAFEHFSEIGDLSVHALAERIRSDGIDLLVDLAGWTAHGRPEALALRCAPVQVNWLGYPGSIGHPALADYILGDPLVTPLSHASFYSEKIAQLPHCYLPADTSRQSAQAPSRDAAGLPKDKFVFCSLNNNYKYNPPLFDLWCEILRQTPESVLWLSFHGDAAAEFLRAEVAKRGIDAERLLFARRVESNEDHLARLSLADLALDTFPYNSHSTGVDTLWAGVPMVTKMGELFASRVGASVVSAAGLSELVTMTEVEYVAIAIALYRDRNRLATLRSRLSRVPGSAPLFDMHRFTHDIESMYLRMLDAAAAGKHEHLPAA